VTFCEKSLIACRVCALFLPFTLLSCSHDLIDSDSGNPQPVRYVAIDIDDVFMPNWDYTTQKYGKVKMNEDDVKNLVQFSAEVQSLFGERFRFTLGFNCGFYDSTNPGDRAFLACRNEFDWYDHLPRHEQVMSSHYSAAQIESLFTIGSAFAARYDLKLSHYQITPAHEGLWPPYDPLYQAFEKFGIQYTAAAALTELASYGTVIIIPRHYIGISSAEYSFTQVSRDRLQRFADDDYRLVMENPAVVFYSHQVNYAGDRIAEVLIRMLIEKFQAQTTYRIMFLPAEDVAKIVHDTPLVVHKIF
jgi:hypothetical protein